MIRPPGRIRSLHAGDNPPPPPGERAVLAAEYLRLVADLNRLNSGILWWAGPLASKNPFDSSLFEDLVGDIFRDLPESRKTGGAHPVAVAGNLPVDEGVHQGPAGDLVGFRDALREQGFRLAFLAKGIVCSGYFFLISCYKMCIARAFLGRRIRRAIREPGPVDVLRSWIDHRSFDPEGRYTDVYLGELPTYLAESRKVAIVAEIVWTSSYLGVVRLIRRKDREVPIIPQEYFLTLGDLVRAAVLPFTGGPARTEGAVFRGRNVSPLVERAVRSDRASPQIRNNLAIHYLTRRLVRKMAVARFTYSFENHAYEKMMILALREGTPEAWITGYQHGGLSRMLFNYFLAEGEADFVPLPDRIITTGEESRRILVEEGHFPVVCVEAGCALRYRYLEGLPVREQRRNGVLFVPLPVDMEAARAVLSMLVEAVGGSPAYTAKVTSHPLVAWEDVTGRGGGRDLPPNILRVEGETTRDLLLSSDIVLYTQTTTCIEALRLGIPVVYLDVFTIYDADYIMKDIAFRWVADGPESLRRVLSEIHGLGDADFAARQDEGVAYARSFFAPVDEDSLRKFAS